MKVSFSSALKGLENKLVVSAQSRNSEVTETVNSKSAATAQKLMRNKSVQALLDECGVTPHDIARNLYVGRCMVAFAHEMTQETADAKNVTNPNFVYALQLVVAFLRAKDSGQNAQLTKNTIMHAISGFKLLDEATAHLIPNRNKIGVTQGQMSVNFLERLKIVTLVGDVMNINNNILLQRAVEKFAL